MASPAALCLIFLVPGAFGTGTSSIFLKGEDYFAEYRDYLEARGCQVRMAQFPQDAKIEERSLVLKDQLGRLLAANPGARADLVAHSQGGLDARFALKTLGVTGVRSVVTIGTPHAGTPVADWVIDHRERGSFLYWLLRVVGGYDLRALSFAGEMREEFLKKHEARFAPVDGVRYASARGVCRSGCHWALRFLASRAGLGEGDGIIPAESQRFGEDLGEYDLDHISEVGVDDAKRAERMRYLKRLWDWLGNTESKGSR